MNLRNALPWLVLALVALTLAASGAFARDKLPDVAPTPATPKAVDFVICLDTSGSMQGLIHAARQKLWSVVSEVATLKPQPKMRVALLTYGGPGHADRGHVIVQSDLTEDLDLISEKLFALGTRGGTEYVGRVLHYALADLSWSTDAGLKTIFVAGNESADQDKLQRYEDVAKRAVSRGVFVNAIYCGGPDDEVAAGWRRVAALGTGRFSHIDHNHGTVNVTTPFDKELAELSGKLNGTYVFYGAERKLAEERQSTQDTNAATAGAPAAAARAETKAGKLYRAPKDLVARFEEDEELDLEAIDAEHLPEVMRGMDAAARKKHLAAKSAERARIKARIKELGEKRAAHVRQVMEEQKLDDSRSLDKALRDTVREQARKQGFRTEERGGE